MSTSVGSIHYDLGLDTSKFDAASSKLKGGLSSIQSAGEKVALASIAMGTAFAFAGRAALNNASDYQQSRIAFDTMLGSAEAGMKIMKELSDFAKRTPFTLPDVVKGAKSLLAYGIEAENIIPTFNALGNIAAGVGRDKLPQLVLAYGQVRTATKLTGMELRQFTEAGVPLLDALAKQSGKSAAQIKKDMEDGAAPSFEEVQKAIFGMSQNGGKFFNLMEKQSQTFAGRMSNIGDSVGQIIRGMLGIDVEGNVKPGSIFDKVSKAALKLMTFLENNKDSIINAVNAIFGSILIAADKIIAFVSQHKDDIKNFLKGSFTWLLDNKDTVAVFIGTTLVAAFASLAYSVIAATWPIYAIGAAVAAGYFLYKRYETGVKQVIEKLKDMWNATRGLREFMANQFMAAWRDLVNAFNRAKEALQPFMVQIKWLAMFIPGVLIIAIVIFVKLIYDLIIVIVRLIGWFAQLLAWLIQVGSAIIQFFVNIPNAIHNFFVGADTWLINSGRSILQGLWNGMVSMMGAILPWLAGTGWRVVNAVGNLFGILWGAGWHALNGLWEGMKNSWHNITGWLSGLAQRIKNLKGPIDKDKVMLLGEGKAVMQGFNKGLIAGYQEVERTLSGITASMSQGNTVANAPLAQGSAQAPNATTNNNIYGNITLGDTAAVNTFFNRLDRNGELARKGMATI